jgi:hypothetical protein
MASLEWRFSKLFRFINTCLVCTEIYSGSFSVKRSKHYRGVTQKIVGRFLALEG